MSSSLSSKNSSLKIIVSQGAYKSITTRELMNFSTASVYLLY